MDLVVNVERIPRRGETLRGEDLARFPGGKGANQAYATARLGGDAVMIGQVGRDGFGADLLSSLRGAGADTSRVGESDRPTGTALIAVQADGDNAIVVSAGANATLTPDLALERMSCVEAGDYVLGQLEVPIETVEAAFAEARRRGAITILDPAPARALPASLLGLVDYLTPNQTEAAALIGVGVAAGAAASGAGNTPERAVAERLLTLGPRNVVLKLGDHGCYLAGPGLREAVPAFHVNAVDTTAAGDVFNAAFGLALAEGRTPAWAARFACAAAAISVTRKGAQASAPARDEVDEFLAARVRL